MFFFPQIKIAKSFLGLFTEIYLSVQMQGEKLCFCIFAEVNRSQENWVCKSQKVGFANSKSENATFSEGPQIYQIWQIW